MRLSISTRMVSARAKCWPRGESCVRLAAVRQRARIPGTRLALALVALVLAGCGDEIAPIAPDASTAPVIDAGACATPASQRLLPLAVGTTWTYRVTPGAGAAPVLKKNTVLAYEDVGGAKAGTNAFRIRTEKTDGATVSWQEDRCDG